MTVWEFILEKHVAGIPTAFLLVLKSSGSSPGRQGFKMAVAADGSMNGTIGGGIMEHKFVEMARNELQHSFMDAQTIRQIHDKTAARNQSGMICSGEQTIFLYQINEKDIPAIQALQESLNKNINGLLTVTNKGISFSGEVPSFHYSLDETDDHFVYKEKTGRKNVLHIIGGGHCALSFSRLMSRMDFYIKVYDERAGLNTMEQNTYANEQIIVPSYEKLNELIEEGNDVYVVIMTFGYRTDDIALKALLGKQFKYIGMLGSKKKIEKLFTEYEASDMKPYLENVHSPIGIQIKSQTTEEIAISIAAEIIAVKNKDQ